MFKKIVSQDPLNLVTLDEVKKQCRVFTTFEDDYLTSLILPYCEMAQSYTCRMLTPGTATVLIEGYQSDILLPFGEVTEVTSVVLDDVDVTDFTFKPVSQKVYLNQYFQTAEITFSAGYTAIPESVKAAILMMISTAYNNRDDVVVGQQVYTMPSSSRDLLDRVKLPWQ